MLISLLDFTKSFGKCHRENIYENVFYRDTNCQMSPTVNKLCDVKRVDIGSNENFSTNKIVETLINQSQFSRRP